MPHKLNPQAQPFVPSSSPGASWCSEEELESEECISQEELDELEAAEEWVALQAGIEEAENAFLIELALEFAPPKLVEEVERCCGADALLVEPSEEQKQGQS